MPLQCVHRDVEAPRAELASAAAACVPGHPRAAILAQQLQAPSKGWAISEMVQYKLTMEHTRCHPCAAIVITSSGWVISDMVQYKLTIEHHVSSI